MAAVTEWMFPSLLAFFSLGGRQYLAVTLPSGREMVSACDPPRLAGWPQGDVQGDFMESKGVRGPWRASGETWMFGLFINFLKWKLRMWLTREWRRSRVLIPP